MDTTARVRPVCASCRYARMAQQLGAMGLLCTRHPPVIQLLPGRSAGEVSMAGLWPPIALEDGCGEHLAEEGA